MLNEINVEPNTYFNFVELDIFSIEDDDTLIFAKLTPFTTDLQFTKINVFINQLQHYYNFFKQGLFKKVIK